MQIKLKDEGRCEWLDIAKGLAICLVVLGHSMQYYLWPGSFQTEMPFTLLYSFHMPLFFILSGFAVSLSSRKAVTMERFSQKIKRLIVPYIVWALLNFIIMGVYEGFDGGRLLNYICTPSRGGLWYLWALFWIDLIHSCVYMMKRNLRLPVLIIIYVSLLIISGLIDGHFGLYEISKYFIFYTVGVYLSYFYNLLKPIYIPIYTLLFGVVYSIGAFDPNGGGNFYVS